MDEHHEKPGFRVTDRRRFTDQGARRDEEEAAQESAASSEAKPSDTPSPAGPATVAPSPSVGEDATFSSFVFGLSVEALMLLGEVEAPGEKVERNLPAAKHVIDVLAILRAKTSGNLDQAESQLLDSILYDLRMRYVKLVRGTT